VCVCVFIGCREMCLWFKEFQPHLHGLYKLITWAMLVADLVTWLGHAGEFHVHNLCFLLCSCAWFESGFFKVLASSWISTGSGQILRSMVFGLDI
jgi:hypothetical protein